MRGSTGKAARLREIEALLLSNPEGLSQAEIARRVGVNRSTIHRYLPELGALLPLYEGDDGRLRVDRAGWPIELRMTLHEAMAVHLATRLLATRTDRHNPHAASALRKLGLALKHIAPRISHHLQLSADRMDDAGRRDDPSYLQVLERLTLAWAEGRKLHIWHRHASTGEVREYTLSPYFIEPYAVGQTAYVMGLREPPGALRTLKIERIERAETLSDRFEVPPDFDAAALLADAWGIWGSEAKPVEVALRFHPRVARRVQETQWHQSERIDEQADGSLLWRAPVAEPQEMMPWIRGWGADVEVLAPEALREEMTRAAARLAVLYSVSLRENHG